MVAMWMIEAERHLRSLDEPYGWIITRDRAHEIAEAMRAAGQDPYRTDDSEVGTIGPRSVPDEIQAMLREGKGVEFRLMDEGDLDAGEEPGTVAEGHPDHSVVFEGRLIDPSEEWDFAPLDDFGPYRAIGIQYRDAAGDWEYL